MGEGRFLRVGNRGCLCQAWTLRLLDRVEMVFKAVGAVRGSRALGKDLEEMSVYQATWFPSHVEIYQCINNQYRHTGTSAHWLSVLSVEKLVVKILVHSAMRIVWQVLCSSCISTRLHVGVGGGPACVGQRLISIHLGLTSVHNEASTGLGPDSAMFCLTVK